MKKQSISGTFGLSQREMAMILGVSASQYSMFECGQRSLPAHALELLTQLLEHQSKMAESKPTGNIPLEPIISKKIQENKYQIALTQKKIKALSKKVAINNRLLHLASLNTDLNKKTAGLTNRKLAHPANKNPEQELAALHLKLECLMVEREFLERKRGMLNDSRQLD